MIHERVERSGISCILPNSLKASSSDKGLSIVSKNRKEYKDALIQKLPIEGAREYIDSMMAYKGDSDFMGKKVTLIRKGVFGGTRDGKELLTTDYIHATNKTFYRWRIFVCIENVFYSVVVRGEGNIENDEEMWLDIINSIEVYNA
jgi:hypothetical protein